MKYNKIFIYLFIPFFWNSPPGQTRRQIFMLNCSNDVDSHNGVPYGGFDDIAPHFGGEKGKVFPYSLPSVGPGADPGVQAVSPQVT